MRSLTILCDMDGIIVDLLNHWLDAIALDHGIRVQPEEIVEWDMAKCGRLRDLGPKIVYGYLQKPGFFRKAPALPGAVAGLKALHDAGHNIVILSSPSGPISAGEKLEWLAEHLPFLPSKQIMLANLKTLVKGDVLIDDHPQTLLDYSQAWPEALAIGIKYPYNKHLLEAKLVTLCPECKREDCRSYLPPPVPQIRGYYTHTHQAWLEIAGEITALAESYP